MDPRILRTKQSLQSALLELCTTDDFQSLSVSHIVEAAGVNRSTFYQHYADKETLLADALDAIAATAQAQLEAADGATEVDPRELIRRYFAHVRQNRNLYRMVLSSNGPAIIVERLTSRVAHLAERGLRTTLTVQPLALPINIAAASLAGSFIGILREWINMHPTPPADDAAEWAWVALSSPSTGRTESLH